MALRILMLGDIVGSPGCRAVAQQLPVLRARYEPDLVIVNAENAAQGSGLTPTLYERLCKLGIDGITLGDHVYKKDQIVAVLERQENIIRPANISAQAKGRRWMRLRPSGGEYRGPSVFVVTVLGRLFVGMPANDPFAAVEGVLAELPEPNPIVIVEVHAEATSEKVAMGWYFNGKVAAVLGTHTHIPTADARVLPGHLPEREGGAVRRSGAGGVGGTAYITDLGMCGPVDSVLGRRVDRVLKHMTTNMHSPFDVAEGNPQVQGVFLEIDEQSRRATRIEQVIVAADESQPPFSAGSGE